MDQFISEYEYVLAWSAYLVSGLLFALFWWKVTSSLGHSGWRDLLRGMAIVTLFTPWYVSDSHEHLAPAAMVVAMDLLLGSSDNGLTGSLVLLITTALMLGVLILKRLMARRS